ncbi:MAG: elongation factor Ts [Flavobacteriaceae bacterium]|nr:elongation factor Ts [Flavobacteriaceae bacterium]
MSITAADVNKLRTLTGAGMMDCKKALTETNGDFEAAVDFLRKKGQKVSASRSDRENKEGAVIAATTPDGKVGVIISLNCETDFVAKNDDFVSFAKKIAEKALQHQPSETDALKGLTIDGATIADLLMEQVGRIGEKIDVNRYEILRGDNVVAYIHGSNRMGVLVSMNQPADEPVNAAGRDAAMQIAAMNPVALDKGDVDATTLQRELEIGKEQARAEGKPEEMLEKIAQGKLNRFYKDSTLLNQDFVKDGSKTVAQMLDSVSKGLTVTAFKRVALG